MATKFLPEHVKATAKEKLLNLAVQLTNIANTIEDSRDDEILCALGGNERHLNFIINVLESHQTN